MAKVQYKSKKGVLHIGGGHFFYAQKPVKVADNEVDNLLATYSDLELVEEKKEESTDPGDDGKQEETGEPDGHEENSGDLGESDNKDVPYTKTSIKKLNADDQRNLIVELGGDPEETNNEDERVALILQLQEENKEKGE